MSTAGVPLLEARGIVKRFGGVTAVADGNMTIRAGEMKGLIGPNGCGKSTLLNALSGRIRPDEGEVLLGGEPLPLGRYREVQHRGVVLVAQELALAPEDLAWQSVVLGSEPRRRGFVDRRAARRRAQEALEMLGHDVDLDAPTHTLSPVEQRLLTIARGAGRPGVRILIFDEPTAGLPHHEAVRVIETLRGLVTPVRSLVLVSHHLDEVVEACDSVSLMRDGRNVRVLDGDEVRKDEIVDLLVGAASPRAETTGTARAGVPGAAVRPVDAPGTAAEADVAGDAVARLEDVHAEHLRGVSLEARRGEVVGVAGLLASGVDDVLGLLTGERRAARGTVRVGARQVMVRSPHAALRAGVGYVSGQRSRMVIGSMTVAEHVSLSALGRFRRAGLVSRRGERAWVEQQLDALGVKGAPDAPMTSLSGGNQQRALFARWLDSDVDLLVIDQPTVGVDIVGRGYILDAVRAMSGTRAVVVAGEPEELVSVCDRVVCLRRGTVARQLVGDEITEAEILNAIA